MFLFLFLMPFNNFLSNWHGILCWWVLDEKHMLDCQFYAQISELENLDAQAKEKTTAEWTQCVWVLHQ